MSEVTLKINDRGYGVSCDPGQEEHLISLAEHVDSRLRDIAAAGAASTQSHLFVLTSLVLADEVYELRRDIAALNQKVHMYETQGSEAAQPSGLSEDDERALANIIDNCAEMVERVTDRLGALDKEASAA